jgi:hypothetical protein
VVRAKAEDERSKSNDRIAFIKNPLLMIAEIIIPREKTIMQLRSRA